MMDGSPRVWRALATCARPRAAPGFPLTTDWAEA
jgi:hypothetical protein